MALPKQIMRAGSLYEGFELIVGTTAGGHILVMSQTANCVVNSISITPDAYGEGDTFKLEHVADDGTTVVNGIAYNIYNLGANLSINFDFPALEQMSVNEQIRLTYTKVDTGAAVNVHTIVEYGGIKRTA